MNKSIIASSIIILSIIAGLFIGFNDKHYNNTSAVLSNNMILENDSSGETISNEIISR